MDRAWLRRLNGLLETALELPPEAREAWVRSLPDEHHTLRPTLLQMIERGTGETDSFLQCPIQWPLDADGDTEGDVIGAYRLIAPLGQGGMARVWRARRIDGTLQRDVALKLPHAAWAQGTAKRMQRERDILASLEHARIARLYDAGLTEAGRPWLAMELVEGVPIDSHAQTHGLSIRERLRLFLQVADAVGYAHTRLVVHRDLKPNNILVTHEGQVRLLDFGVAQLIEDDRPDAEQLTRQLGRPVTPDYAAPELLGGKPVGTAADVYSLGIVLYELLTGERPYSIDRHAAPSLEDAAWNADTPLMHTRARSKSWMRALQGDLDAIVAKALNKAAADRYPTVEAFAADVHRHLEGLPVLAQAPSRRYLAAKFVRHHRKAIGAVSAVGLSLVSGLGVALWQASAARAEAARAEQVKQFIASIFQQARPRSGIGGVVTATDLLQTAARRIESELASNPLVAAELGVTVAEGLNALGEPAKSEAALRAAVARIEQVHGPGHAIGLWAKVLLADSIDEQDVDESLRLLTEVLPHARAGLPATVTTLATALYLQSFALAKKNRADESIAALKEGIAVSEQHLGPTHEITIRQMGLLANTHGRFGHRVEQLRVATKAMERVSALQAPRPDGTLTAVERWYAEALRVNDRPVDAIPTLRRALQDQRALDVADTPRVRSVLVQLALALDSAGQQDEGLRLMREAVALEAVHNPKDSDDRLSFVGRLAAVLMAAGHVDEAMALNQRLATIEQQLGSAGELLVLNRRVLEARGLAMQGEFGAASRAAATAAERAGDRFAQQRAEAWTAAALSARLRRHPGLALTHAQQALADPRAATFPLAVLASANAEEGLARLDQGDFARGELSLRQSLEQYARAQVAPSPRMAPALIGMARVHLHLGHGPRAQSLLMPLVDAWAQVNPGGPGHREALHWLSRAQAAAARGEPGRDRRGGSLGAAADLADTRQPVARVGPSGGASRADADCAAA